MVPNMGPMDHTTITIIGPSDWTSSFGKETSNTSFGIRALKKDDHIISVLNPSKYPEKLWSLLFTLSLTDRVLLNVQKIDKDLGETMIAIDLAGIRNGMLHIGEMVDRARFAALIEGTVIAGWEEMDPDPSLLREKLFDLKNEWPMEIPLVVIDQAFPVKGVGTVALGFVTGGSISKHQELFTFPGNKRIQIRSIQIHDKDHNEAPAGARVGLALKNIDHEDLPRGCVLSTKDGGLVKVDSVKIRFTLSPYWKDPIEKGMKLHLWSSLQFLPVTIGEIIEEREIDGKKNITLEAVPESQIWIGPSSRFGLAFLDSKSFRLFAVGETI